MALPDLAALRDRIEAVDRQIIQLIAERLRIVDGVVEAKLASASPFRDREREESLIARLRAMAAEVGVDPHEIERLYRVVMDLSVAHQEQTVRDRDDVPLRVTYQGVEGSYSHLAAQRRYAGRAGGALLSGHDSFRAAAQAVLGGTADLALLPIENTTAGSINETYDLLAAGGLHITGEVVASIEHCLLAIEGVTLDELRVVISHPQALAQCHDFFAQHPHLTARAELDTAGSARR
ncbi:MAG: chorismate mutase, partial [Myxococcota bacterium]|nr:chorismate mutase [Myxococcota bacterium]